MSQIKYYIIVLLVLVSGFGYAQKLSKIEEDKLENTLKEKLEQAEILSDRGDYLNAISQFEEAIPLTKTINDVRAEGVIYTKIGKLQYLINQPEKAISTLTKAIEIHRENEDFVNLGLTYNIRGVIQSNLKDYQSALDFFKSATENLYEPKSEKYQADVNLNEALVYLKIDQVENAMSKLNRAIEVSKKHELFRTLSSAYINNARAFYKFKDYNLALEQAKLALDVAQEYKLTNQRNEAFLVLSEIYQSKSQFKSANTYLKKHMQLSDSILNVKREAVASGKISNYLWAFKNSENQQLEEQETEAKSDENLARITTILSISLITILSLLTLSLYKNNNIRLHTNNMLQIKNDELIVAKEKAELASKTKANFLSTVTHELRTPLYAVTGLTSLLLDEEPKEKQIPHLKSLKFSGDYLLTFINDILQINKIEANKVELDPEDFNLKTKIENVIAALYNSAKDNNTNIHLEYEKDLPETFIGDQLKISQILINLLGNAIKFTHDGDIWVKVKSSNNKGNLHDVQFEIKDNGIGISKEKQEQMFDSFSQGSIQINRKYGGTGLGLSIVKGLIKILKGKIWLNSQLGQGTSFFFELPLKHVVSKKKIETAKESKHLENIKTLDLESMKILVVEDNKINQMITKKILSKMGLTCEIVDNGEDAVEKVRENEYNVVLMDIHMPGISGLEATKRIRQFNKELTIFALTAVTIEDKMHEFDEAGFNDIISKPFKQETFEKKLYTALSGEETTA